MKHMQTAAGNRRTTAGSLIAAAILYVVLLLTSGACSAAPFAKNFSYYADHQQLSAVLNTFAQDEGYPCTVSPALSGTVSGRFTDVPPVTFLNGMQSAFGVSWYVLGGELHFYSTSEKERAFITPRSGSASQLYQALQSAGVFSSQLPARLNTSGNVITVSGPPPYLSQIRMAAAAWEASQTEKIVMQVFPLKYAWADDITVNSMDKTVTIPGIASILRAMVLGNSVSGTRVTQERATVQKLGGHGLSAQGAAESEAVPVSPQASGSPVNTGSVSIIADPRVNAVLVSDASYRMPYYTQVIKDLDKPVELVEIHAAIVDIDTDFKRDLGINFQGTSARRTSGLSYGGSLGGGVDNSLPSLSSTTDSAGAMLSTIYTHGTDFFMTRIKALEDNNDARVLGRPSVLTVDNIQATLENTTTYYVEVQGYQAVDLYKVEAGTVLRVTPHIIRENGTTSIKLVVNVQDDQDSSGSSTTSSGVPPIKQTKINTQAVVNAGQSLLIGGYYYEQKGTDAAGVPMLKDIPVLGGLFKTTSKTNKKMERLILLTPRIVHLNDRNIPQHADDPSFHRSPTQTSYEERIPAPRRDGAGCSRKNPSPAVSVRPLEETSL